MSLGCCYLKLASASSFKLKFTWYFLKKALIFRCLKLKGTFLLIHFFSLFSHVLHEIFLLKRHSNGSKLRIDFVTRRVLQYSGRYCSRSYLSTFLLVRWNTREILLGLARTFQTVIKKLTPERRPVLERYYLPAFFGRYEFDQTFSYVYIDPFFGNTLKAI